MAKPFPYPDTSFSSSDVPFPYAPSATRGRLGLAPMEGVIDADTRALLSEDGALDW